MKNIVILSSGKGTNLQKIIDAVISNQLFCCQIKLIISNRNSPSITLGIENNIPTLFAKWNKNDGSLRIDYDLNLAVAVNAAYPDIIVLAGWNHILGAEFLAAITTDNIINLHPALPGTFPGNNAIADALAAFNRGMVNHTGIMVHRVTPVVDVGKVLAIKRVPIYTTDDINSLKARIQYNEKAVLIEAIEMTTNNLLKRGKVRDIYHGRKDELVIVHTDRLSACDKHIMDIPGKGNVLAAISSFWFDKMSPIVPNHVIKYSGNYLICRKCEVIPIEFIVRGYITGNSKTSMWKNYADGMRNYCGIDLPEGLIKNQKLDEPLLTPTTTGDVDELISSAEIIQRNILTQSELNTIYRMSYNLYSLGSHNAHEHNLILVDTKYEFGRTSDGKIILIDEVHTPDSSRFWVQDTYLSRFNSSTEPEKLDKDCIRDYVVANPNYTEIPLDLQQRVIQSYIKIYELLTANTCPVLYPFANLNVEDDLKALGVSTEKPPPPPPPPSPQTPMAVILSGSEKDSGHVAKIVAGFKQRDITYECYIASAHKQTRLLLGILDKYNHETFHGIFITVAGRSNALSGVVAGYTRSPVIACPPFADKLDMMVNIHSSLQCPSGIPVMTILEPGNVADACERIFSLY